MRLLTIMSQQYINLKLQMMKTILHEIPEGETKSQLSSELLKIQGVRKFQLVNELAYTAASAYKCVKFPDLENPTEQDISKSKQK